MGSELCIRDRSRDDAQALVDYLTDRASDYGYKLTKSMAKHRSIELMDEVGIPEPYKRFRQYPFEFSGGMRQRIVIAIALSANPDILICDEPTTALDVTIQAQILELINNLKKQRNLSVIFITHDLGVVARIATRVVVMYAGELVEKGTSEQVIFDPVHPYSYALMSSIIVPEEGMKAQKLSCIPGAPPNLKNVPEGCRFADRCAYAIDACRQKKIEIDVFSEGRYKRCLHSVASLRAMYEAEDLPQETGGSHGNGNGRAESGLSALDAYLRYALPVLHDPAGRAGSAVRSLSTWAIGRGSRPPPTPVFFPWLGASRFSL